MDDKTMAGRIVQIIDAVTAEGPLTLAELARTTCLPRSTAHRIAEDLCSRHLLVKAAERYELGTRVISWGCHAMARDRLRVAAAPVLADLHSRSGRFAWLYRVDGEDIQLLDRTLPASVPDSVSRLPWPRNLRRAGLLLAAGGQVAMADHPMQVDELLRQGLPRTSPYSPVRAQQIVEGMTRCRETGRAIDREGFLLGWACVAAPIRDGAGATIGAIGITGRSVSFDPARLAAHVLTGAEAVSACLVG